MSIVRLNGGGETGNHFIGDGMKYSRLPYFTLMHHLKGHDEIQDILEKTETVRSRRFEQLERQLQTARSKGEVFSTMDMILQESLFLKKLVQDYAFRRYVNARLIKCGWAQAHMNELGLICLTDWLYPGKLPLRRLDGVNRKASGDVESKNSRTGYETRTRYRIIRERYSELFELLSRPESYKKEHESFKTILRSQVRCTRTRSECAMDAVYSCMMAYHQGGLEAGMSLHQRRTRIGIRLAQGDPDEILSLIEFQDFLKKRLEVLRQDLGEPDAQSRWLKDQVDMKGPAVVVLHTIMLDAVSVRWFRERSDSFRRAALNRKCRLSYTEDDARSAVDSNLSWFGNSDMMAARILLAAFGLVDNGKHMPAIRLAEACMSRLPADSLQRSVAHRCLGFAHLAAAKPKKALTEFRESERGMLALGMNAESAFDEGFIAECYMELNKPPLAQREWGRAVSHIKATMNDRPISIQMLLMLVSAAKRTGHAQVEQELLEVGFEQSKQLDDPSYSLVFSKRIIESFNRG